LNLNLVELYLPVLTNITQKIRPQFSTKKELHISKAMNLPTYSKKVGVVAVIEGTLNS